MRKSARILGMDIGLNAEEMNCLLMLEGFLSGEPGAYFVTDKGAPYADEEDHHRGTGGYAWYNRYWTTRTWDESVLDEIDITGEKLDAVRAAVAERRRAHREDLERRSAEAEAAYLAQQNADNVTESPEDITVDLGSLIRVGGVVAGLLAVGYGVYKIVPRVIDWWKGNKKPENTEKATGAITAPKMVCPACEHIMSLEKKEDIWQCKNCAYSISNKEVRDGVVFWYCDKCEAFLNIQKGFSTNKEIWVCTDCGHENEVYDMNMDDTDK